MVNAHREILSDAIARNCGIVLSLPSAALVRHHKSRLLSEGPEGFWVESVPSEAGLIEELLGKGCPVGISFRNGTNKAVFAVPIRRRDPGFVLNAGTTIEALLVSYPDEIKLIQRRNHYRVGVIPESGLSVRLWRIPERVGLSYRPPSTAEIEVELRDISAGGLGVVLTERGNVQQIVPDQRLRIELTFRDSVLFLEGQFRGGTAASKVLRTGILFKSLDRDVEGRQKLTQLNRIVGELQREEARRSRLGLAV